MGNILITGGAGFIGSHLARQLVSLGYNVTVLDNLNPQIHGINPERESSLYKSLPKNIRFIKSDINNKERMIEAIQNEDVIIHLAAETGTGQSMYEIEQYCRTNICGTALILDILANEKTSIKKFILASSRAVYGEGKYYCKEFGYVYPDSRSEIDMKKGNFEVKLENRNVKLNAVATDEGSKIHPSSVYGITKQVQEQLVMTICPPLDIAPIIFRYQNVYGPGQSLRNPYTGILSIFSNRIKKNKQIIVFEDGKASRDFVYIDDVVRATILGIENEKAGNQIFNVGSGIQTSIIDIANHLMQEFGISVPIVINGSFRIGDIRHNFADLNKIRIMLGFSPSVDLKTGLHNFVEWVKQQDEGEDKYEYSLAEMKEKGLYK